MLCCATKIKGYQSFIIEGEDFVLQKGPYMPLFFLVLGWSLGLNACSAQSLHLLIGLPIIVSHGWTPAEYMGASHPAYTRYDARFASSQIVALFISI